MIAFAFDSTCDYPQSIRSVEISTSKGLFLGQSFDIQSAPTPDFSIKKGQFLGREFAIQPIAAQTAATGSLTYRGVAY